MKTIDIASGENRWEEMVAALRGGESVELTNAGVPLAVVPPDAEDWRRRRETSIQNLRKLRESLPLRGKVPTGVEILREIREE